MNIQIMLSQNVRNRIIDIEPELITSINVIIGALAKQLNLKGMSVLTK